MRHHIHITQKNIDEGIPRASRQCAGALALKDEFGPDCDCSMGPWWTRIKKVGERDIFKRTTKPMLLFMAKYDSNHKVKPMGFYFYT